MAINPQSEDWKRQLAMENALQTFQTTAEYLDIVGHPERVEATLPEISKQIILAAENYLAFLRGPVSIPARGQVTPKENQGHLTMEEVWEDAKRETERDMDARVSRALGDEPDFPQHPDTPRAPEEER